MPIRPAVLRRWCQLFALLLFSLLAVGPVSADPSGRVGRIAWLSGSVHLHQPDSGESSSALLNWPISSGDVLSTGAGARSEVQIGSTLLRLDSGSVLDFVQVDDQRVHLRLLEGSVVARLRSADAAREFELSTREGRFSARDVGSYRFDSDRSVVTATVAAGSLRFEASDSAVEVSAGQRVQFWNDGGTHYHVSAPANDDFALWSVGRDRPVGSSSHARYVSPEMTGAADLDAYGSWSENAEYGAVWFPRAVAADWAPYRTGRWVWVAPWGWTWVGDEPWGFAPFHYGRWVLYDGAWGWVPGRRVARPVYAPALVAWVGTPGFGVSAQVGVRPAVGWFPLAPREVYVPPYRSSPNYVRQVNVTHVTQINNITTITSNPQTAVERMPYAHRQQPRAVTMVPADVLTQQRPVSAAAMLPRDRQQLGSQAVQVQVQAPVAAPPVGAQRRLGAERQSEQGRREREAGRSPAERPASGRDEQRQQTPETASALPPARMPPGTVGAVPVPAASPSGRPLGAPEPAPAPGGRSVVAPAARGVEQQGSGPSIAETSRGRGVAARPDVAPPVGSAAQPAASASPPPSPPSVAPGERVDRSVTPPVRRPPEARESREVGNGASGAGVPGEGAPVPSAPGRPEQNVVPPTPAARSPSAIGATGAERSGANLGRPWPTPERAEPHPVVPLTVPAQSPVGGRQRAERPTAEVDGVAPAVRPVRPEQRIEMPPQPVAPPLPAAPRFPERPAVAAPGQPVQPGAERSDPRTEQRRSDGASRRDDSFPRQGRQEMRVFPAPMAMPQRPAAEPGRVDSPAANERQVRPERRQESGGGGQRERPRDGRDDRLPRGSDG